MSTARIPVWAWIAIVLMEAIFGTVIILAISNQPILAALGLFCWWLETRDSGGPGFSIHLKTLRRVFPASKAPL